MQDTCSSRPVVTTNSSFKPLIDIGILNAEMLTSRQVAVMFDKSHKTIERYARQGAIPAHFRFNGWYFLKSELDEWLRSEIQSTRQPCRVN